MFSCNVTISPSFKHQFSQYKHSNSTKEWLLSLCCYPCWPCPELRLYFILRYLWVIAEFCLTPPWPNLIKVYLLWDLSSSSSEITVNNMSSSWGAWWQWVAVPLGATLWGRLRPHRLYYCWATWPKAPGHNGSVVLDSPLIFKDICSWAFTSGLWLGWKEGTQGHKISDGLGTTAPYRPSPWPSLPLRDYMAVPLNSWGHGQHG